MEFFTTAEKVATFLKSTDINKWWNQENIQNLRKSFVDKYSNFSENWIDPWVDEKNK